MRLVMYFDSLGGARLGEAASCLLAAGLSVVLILMMIFTAPWGYWMVFMLRICPRWARLDSGLGAVSTRTKEEL